LGDLAPALSWCPKEFNPESHEAPIFFIIRALRQTTAVTDLSACR